VEFEKR